MPPPPPLVERVRSMLAKSNSDYELLLQIHALGLPAILPLVEALQDPTLRIDALQTLSMFGNDARVAAPAAVRLLSTVADDDHLGRTIVDLLKSIGEPAVKPLISRLATADDDEFLWCRAVLSQIEADAVVPELLKLLSADDARLRVRACRILARAGYSAKCDATGTLIERLSDSDDEVRNAAAGALASISHAVTLQEHYRTGDAFTRVGCVRALVYTYSFRGPDALAFFQTALTDEDNLVRIAAAEGLRRAASALSIEALVSAFKSEELDVRLSALRFCRENSEGVSQMAHFVRELSRDQQTPVRREAAAVMALKQWCRGYDVARIRAILDDALRDHLDLHRLKYLAALRHPDALGRSLIPAVKECLHDSRRDIAVAAAGSLAAIGGDSLEVMQALIEVLDSPSAELRRSTIRALGSIGPTAAAALPKLRELLTQSETMEEVLQALECFGPAAEPALYDVVDIIGRRTEHAPFVLAAIGTREAVVELVNAIDSFGNGDRKDFEAASGALSCIADAALPVLDAEFRKAKPGRYSSLLAGLQLILGQSALYPYVVTALLNGNEYDRFRTLHHLSHILAQSPALLAEFCKLSDAVSRLVQILDGNSQRDRQEVLTIFSILHIHTHSYTDFYRDRLLKCVRRTFDEAESNHDRDDIRSSAEIMGLEK